MGAEAITRKADGLTARDEQVESFVHFSNGLPGLTLEAACGDLTVGIQVQGMQLRRFVSSKSERKTLEDEVLDGPLLASWLAQQACGRPLTGKNDAQPQRESGERRAGKVKEASKSTLRAFNAKKFLYSAISLDRLTLQEVHEEVLSSMVQATRLAPSEKSRGHESPVA